MAAESIVENSVGSGELQVSGIDGHRWSLLARIPEAPRASLLWLPALGVAARHYLPFADALAAQGVAVFLHEWRGHGSSNLRAGRDVDWNYETLLLHDLPATEAVIAASLPSISRVIGGHSLGGQLACCRLALAPDVAQTVWLVASGSPYWRVFPARNRWWLPLAYRFLPWLADQRGALPGRAVGFGGNEARGLIRDWARCGLSGCYAGHGLDIALDPALANASAQIHAVWFEDDWLAPVGSLRELLGKLCLSAATNASVTNLDQQALGAVADHFAWMKVPEAVAKILAAGSRRQTSR